MNKKQREEARKAMAAWDYKGKLAESGFVDIEGGVDGPLLKGPTSICLFSLANRDNADHGLRQDNALRSFDEVADQDNTDLNYTAGTKARYYHHAGLLACQAYREGRLPAPVCHTWALHAQGLGERPIAKQVGIPRQHVREYLRHLRHNIRHRLDIERDLC